MSGDMWALKSKRVEGQREGDAYPDVDPVWTFLPESDRTCAAVG